jgi:signal peptidase II
MTRSGSTWIAFAIASLIFVVDRVLKWVVESSMALGKNIPLIPGVVELTYINNPGGALGALAGQAPLLRAGSVMAVMVALWILFSAKPSWSTALGSGLILGGAASNLLVRLVSGRVPDYVHFFYVFNVADFAIIAGVGVLLMAAVGSLGKGPEARYCHGLGLRLPAARDAAPPS